MAKPSKKVQEAEAVEVNTDGILEAVTAIEEQLAVIKEALGAAPTEEAADETPAEDGAEPTSDVTLPASAEEVDDLDDEQTLAICKEVLGVETELTGKKLKAVLKTIVTVADKQTEAHEEIDVKQAKAAAEFLSLEIGDGDDEEAICGSILEYLTGGGEAAEGEESPAEESEAESSGPSEEQIESAVAEAPDEEVSVMVERLEAFNAEAGDDAIEFNAKKPKAGYTELLKRMVDDEGNLAEWETPYIRGGVGWCCGLMLEETEIKGVQNQACVCKVSGKKFIVTDEGQLEEYIEKKAAPMKKVLLAKKK